MIPADILQLISHEKRRASLAALFVRLHQSNGLFLTPILQLEEPFRSNALEALDGVEVEGGRPKRDEGKVIAAQLGPVRLAAIKNEGDGLVEYDPKGHIYQTVFNSYIVPGTEVLQRHKAQKDNGSFASLGHYQARDVLVKYGWPIRDYRSKGNTRGTVVEVDWLKAEVKKPEASDVIKLLWDSIKPIAEAGQPTTKQNTKGDSPREQYK